MWRGVTPPPKKKTCASYPEDARPPNVPSNTDIGGDSTFVRSQERTIWFFGNNIDNLLPLFTVLAPRETHVCPLGLALHQEATTLGYIILHPPLNPDALPTD